MVWVAASACATSHAPDHIFTDAAVFAARGDKAAKAADYKRAAQLFRKTSAALIRLQKTHPESPRQGVGVRQLTLVLREF